jgi:hypothetical protein
MVWRATMFCTVWRATMLCTVWRATILAATGQHLQTEHAGEDAERGGQPWSAEGVQARREARVTSS